MGSLVVGTDIAAVVVLASVHNPTIASRDWLVNKGVLTQEELVKSANNFVNTPVFAAHDTGKFSITVDQQRLQMTATHPSRNEVEELARKAVTYVEALPETPYTAVGINFTYRADIGVEAQSRLSALFQGEALAGFKAKLPAPNSLWIGGILQYPADDGTLRITVQPASGKETTITVHMNYRLDVTGTERIVNRIKKTAELEQRGLTMARDLLGGKD